MSTVWLAESFDGDALSARIGRDGDVLVAEWPGRATLRVRRDGSAPAFEAAPGLPSLEAEKLRRGAARLLLLHLAGGIPLHGAAVALGGRAAVFVGPARHGKSTLAGALASRAGATVLADDAVAIEPSSGGFDVLALEDALWLDAPAAQAVGLTRIDREPAAGRMRDRGKAAYAAASAEVARVRAALVVHLAFEDVDRAKLIDVEGLDAAGGLLAQMTRFVVDDPEIARRDLAAIGALVDGVRVARLVRPRDLGRLGDSVDLVVAALREGRSR